MACTNWYQSQSLAMAPETCSADRFRDFERRLDYQEVVAKHNRVRLEQHASDIGELKQSMVRIENYLQELNGIIKNISPTRMGEEQGGSTGDFVRQPHVQFGTFQQNTNGYLPLTTPMMQLKKLCQATMTVDEYIEAFNELLTETNIPEDAAMNCFLGGLRTDIQSAVDAFKLSSLASLMHMARIQERSIRAFGDTVSSTAKRPPAQFLSTPSVNIAPAASSRFSSATPSKFTGPSPFHSIVASMTTPNAGIDNLEYNTYEALDSAFASRLLSPASTTTLLELIDPETSSQIWSNLNHYENLLPNQKKGEMEMGDYVAFITCDHLAMLEEHVPKASQILHVPNGLTAEFEPTISIMLIDSEARQMIFAQNTVAYIPRSGETTLSAFGMLIPDNLYDTEVAWHLYGDLCEKRRSKLQSVNPLLQLSFWFYAYNLLGPQLNQIAMSFASMSLAISFSRLFTSYNASGPSIFGWLITGSLGLPAIIYAFLKWQRRTSLNWVKDAARAKKKVWKQMKVPLSNHMWFEDFTYAEQPSTCCVCLTSLGPSWHCRWCQRFIHAKDHAKLASDFGDVCDLGIFEAITGYGSGGSSMALFGQVGGGIYIKAANVGADLVGGVERNIKDEPRNPAVIADNVDDNLGDSVGMGSDLLGSYAESSCAALVIASISSFGVNHNFMTMLYPLLISSMGILFCLIITLFAADFFEIKAVKETEPALRRQLMTIGIAIVSWIALPSSSTIFNCWTQKVVKSWQLVLHVGVANIIFGLALGMLSTVATGLGIDAYGPISDNAGSIEEIASISHRIDITDAIDAAGNTTAAVETGFAIGSAALVSVVCDQFPDSCP